LHSKMEVDMKWRIYQLAYTISTTFHMFEVEISRSSLPSYSMRAVLGGWGFTNATDRPRVNACLLRSIRCGYCAIRLICLRSKSCARLPTNSFSPTSTNSGHLLHIFLPPPTAASQNYNLRICPHNRQLTLHSGHSTYSNFLLANMYSSNILLLTFTNNNSYDNFFP